MHHLGQYHAAGMRLLVLSSSLRGAKRRSNPLPRLRRDGLLRFARNDDGTAVWDMDVVGYAALTHPTATTNTGFP
jgi:hypothetical protein